MLDFRTTTMPDIEKQKYKMPAVAWLKVTDYMHGWLQWEYGGALRIKENRVISILHIPGVRDILREETVVEHSCPNPIINAISATWKNCIDTGMEVDIPATEMMYGITKQTLDLFVPIECPKMCLTDKGVLRPWALDVGISQKQATALQKAIRHEFWNAVKDYDATYAKKMEGKKYPARDMIEDFCADTHTPDIYVEAIRNEWQRRVRRSTS